MTGLEEAAPEAQETAGKVLHLGAWNQKNKSEEEFTFNLNKGNQDTRGNKTIYVI